MQAKLIVNFNALSLGAFRTKSEHIVACSDPNLNYPDPWPAEVPSRGVLKAHLLSFTTAEDEAKDHDRKKASVRDDARIVLTDDLHTLAHYYEIVAKGDVTKLLSTGFDLRHDIVKSGSTDILPAPVELRVFRGSASGVLVVHAHSLYGATSFYLEYTAKDPSVEANWVQAGQHPHCNHIELHGLTPGVIYFVRLRGHNRHGLGLWATSGGVMAV